MNQSNEINELATALAKAQGEIKSPRKDQTAKGKAFSYDYASLNSFLKASLEVLSKNGLAIVQGMDDSDIQPGDVLVITKLIHSSGQWIESRLKLHANNNDPQAMGSAITYGRRYALAAMVGLAPEEDDDAQKATETKPTLVPDHNPTYLAAATAEPKIWYNRLLKLRQSCLGLDEFTEVTHERLVDLKTCTDIPKMEKAYKILLEYLQKQGRIAA
jgi:hypothetical protein